MSEKEQEFLKEMKETVKKNTNRFWSIVGVMAFALLMIGFGWVQERASLKAIQKSQDLRIRDVELEYVRKSNFDYLATIYSLQTEEIITRLDEIIGIIGKDDQKVQETLEKLDGITKKYDELRNAVLFKVDRGATRGVCADAQGCMD